MHEQQPSKLAMVPKPTTVPSAVLPTSPNARVAIQHYVLLYDAAFLRCTPRDGPTGTNSIFGPSCNPRRGYRKEVRPHNRHYPQRSLAIVPLSFQELAGHTDPRQGTRQTVTQTDGRNNTTGIVRVKLRVVRTSWTSRSMKFQS